MAKATAQQCHALTSHYIAKYTAENNKAPSVNRNKARWGFEAMLMDYSSAQVRELLDYFVEHYEHTLEWFLFNYEKVDEEKTTYERNKVATAKRREETKKRLAEWKERRDSWQQQK